MASTPEGKVKDAIKKGLVSLGLIPTSKAAEVRPHHTGKFHMPVSIGMGVHGIPDFYGHYRGRYFEIEAKNSADAEPTALQRHQLHATEVTGAASFVIGRPEDFELFRAWARRVDEEIALLVEEESCPTPLEVKGTWDDVDPVIIRDGERVSIPRR